ncbi:imidazole glycerol phosphate synthase subunit HisH [Ostreibacterium oceani]|uniref:Imidazole glycerol phosphate synthase subunit HisH n=1 Tax=Ostreibacterium oceani TaxID=2654998 RepID=A0A6N7EXN1_9GAMM|nr:imidazole glycerol phosphate synthase subunit HisH [Ostreibacterium oceani]MPV86703.1 imidazole glycerol phosphate synthase subunit HisH [Ostreibacterium oceani]
MQQTITVVDYGMGNLHSVHKAISHVSDANTRVMVSSQAKDINNAHRVVLPGQGAIAGCMQHIHDNGLYDAIQAAAQTKPFLAICIGPQLLMEYSEENGGVNGFGLFKGRCKRFSDEMPRRNPPLKIPHMGWSAVKQTQPHSLWQHIPDGSRFYFVHSYYLAPTDDSITVGTCDYGQIFASALAKDNIFTTQCHPEKSADTGLQLFKNFVHWNP